MTPKGHPTTQYPHPLQMSGCTYTVSNSVRTIAPVGQFSRHPALLQCLHTSDISSQEKSPRPVVCPPSGTGRSTNATCRHVEAPRSTVLS